MRQFSVFLQNCFIWRIEIIAFSFAQTEIDLFAEWFFFLVRLKNKYKGWTRFEEIIRRYDDNHNCALATHKLVLDYLRIENAKISKKDLISIVFATIRDRKKKRKKNWPNIDHKY